VLDIQNLDETMEIVKTETEFDLDKPKFNQITKNENLFE
jgi:hypothetical protein